MSATENPADCTDGACAEYPEFALEWFIDDPIDPAELTITPAAPADPTTEWLSADPDATIPLEDAL